MASECLTHWTTWAGPWPQVTRTENFVKFALVVFVTCKRTERHTDFIMVTLWNRADHYIFILFLSFFLLLFLFHHLISAVGDWMSAILPHMVWP